MGANLLDWSPCVNRAVSIDDEVITAVAPAVALGLRCGVPLPNLLDCVVLPLRGCSAVNDDFVDFSPNDYGFMAFAL